MRRFLNFAPVTRYCSEMRFLSRPVILVHSGTSDGPEKIIDSAERVVQIAAYIGYDVLTAKRNALDAVYEAVRILELHPKFNTPLEFGLLVDKKVKMDSAIMCGNKLKTAAISKISNILHPIAMARKVMEETQHRHMDGETAAKYAPQLGFVTMDEGDTLITPQALQDLKSYEHNLTLRCGAKGTVGAVAVDINGNVAAATVSGGGVGEVTGRVGDQPLIGSGIYANNAIGATCFTTDGDSPISYNAAPRVLSLMQIHNYSPQEAVEQVVEQMKEKFSKNIGAICVDNQGRIGIHHTADHMIWAYRRDSELHYGVQRDQHDVRFFNYC